MGQWHHMKTYRIKQPIGPQRLNYQPESMHEMDLYIQDIFNSCAGGSACGTSKEGPGVVSECIAWFGIL